MKANPARTHLSAEFLRFLVAGGVAAVVNMAARWVLDLWLGYSASIVLAYALGMITAFLLNRRFVFQPSGRSVGWELFWFTVVNLLGVAQVWAISIGLGDYALPALGVERWAHDIAHPIGVVSPVFTSFLGHKFVSFGRKRQARGSGGDPAAGARVVDPAGRGGVGRGT